MTLLALVKAGYGTLAELQQLDTTEYLNLVEYEQISATIRAYKTPNK